MPALSKVFTVAVAALVANFVAANPAPTPAPQSGECYSCVQCLPKLTSPLRAFLPEVHVIETASLLVISGTTYWDVESYTVTDPAPTPN